MGQGYILNNMRHSGFRSQRKHFLSFYLKLVRERCTVLDVVEAETELPESNAGSQSPQSKFTMEVRVDLQCG